MRGHVGAEFTYFWDSGAYPQQQDAYASFSAEAEYYWSWNEENDSLTVTPFARYDVEDDDRTHSDLRELVWLHVGEGWESRVGVSKVFWGVTESQHLVDIINQTDLVEAPDGEEKLGQPMVNLSSIGDNSVLEFFVLPGFRERTFPGEEGRFRGPVPISGSRTEYDSSKEDEHIDTAIRYSHAAGDLEWALSYFRGTGREPIIRPRQESGKLFLIPFYPLIDQVGLEAEWLSGDWTWKLEALYRDDDTADYYAAVGGFEYTFYDVRSSGVDVGLLLEYHYDQRDENITRPFQDDTFIGTRLEFNDIGSTRILMGAIVDNDYGSQSWFLEASGRLGNAYRLLVDARVLSNVDERDLVLDAIREDSFIRMELRRYF